MKNELIKITILILTVLLLFCNCKVYAGMDNPYIDGDPFEVYEDPTENPDAWNPHAGYKSEPELWEKAGVILGIVNMVGIVASVIALMIIGIKYMMGSVEEKAEYKQALAPYALGAIFVFASTTIANVIYNFSTSILK